MTGINEKISTIILEMARSNDDFPIPDLARLILSYVFECPVRPLYSFYPCSAYTPNHCKALKENTFVMTTNDPTIVIYDKTGKKITKLDGADSEIIEIDDNTLVGKYNGFLGIWKNYKLAQILGGNIDEIFKVKNRILTISYGHGMIEIWHKIENYYTFDSHITMRCPSTIAEVHGYLAVGRSDGSIEFFDENTHKSVFKINTINSIRDIIELDAEDVYVRHSYSTYILRKTGVNKYEHLIKLDPESGLEEPIIVVLDNNAKCRFAYVSNSITIWEKSDDRTWQCKQQLYYQSERKDSPSDKYGLIQLIDGTLVILSPWGYLEIWKYHNNKYYHNHTITSCRFEKLVKLSDNRSFVAVNPCSRVQIFS